MLEMNRRKDFLSLPDLNRDESEKVKELGNQEKYPKAALPLPDHFRREKGGTIRHYQI